MREDALGRVLLVKAIEETDRTGELLPLADREHATRAVLRSADTEGAAPPTAGVATRARVVRLLGARAEQLFGPLAERYPVFRDILDRSRIPGWSTALVLLGALACGVALASLDGRRRIDILAFPFLGVIAWNVAVYAVIVASRVRDLSRPAARSRPASPWTQKAIARRLARLVDKTSQVHAKLGEVVSRYAADWAVIGGRLLAAHAARLLHLGAASLALGMILGLYLRGIVLRYEAGWESTFLGPAAVRSVLGLVFGPASALSGIALPQTVAQVDALRWTAGGGDAAPWIHLVAVTLGLYVIAPRFLLAALAGCDAWAWRRAGFLPDALLGYARAALGAAHAGRGSGAVVVVPYAYDMPSAARDGLPPWLEATFGRGAHLDLRPMAPYGEEVALRSMLESGVAGEAEGLVLLLALAATPESESHGLAITAARDAARRARPERELHILVDESAYAARLGGDASLAGRVAERRELWRGFVRGYGIEAELVDLGSMMGARLCAADGKR